MFEGYIGIHLWDEQQVNDLLFAMLLFFFSFFALGFRNNYHLFFRVAKEAWYVKSRQNLFESKVKDSFLFRVFLLLQPLFLCSVILFVEMRNSGSGDYYDPLYVLKYIGINFIVFILFFIVKQMFLYLWGYVFADKEQYYNCRSCYNSIIALWGVSLYLPSLWMVFVGDEHFLPMIIFISLYFLSRFAIIYKIIRIFHIRNKGIFYISLYLCAQEILPLYFLYRGIVYLYNFIG
ncbi:MAG: DUF4271 domain-containing protein [Parabacteroides sp.]|nr:DUF4271 domain-containing protein [Parabacteroides sp.]